MSAQQVRLRIDSILQFMSPYWSWVNCHMVNFLTDKHWLNYVPPELQSEVSTSDCIDECIEHVFWSDAATTQKYPECQNFRRKAQQHSLHHFKDILMTQQDFEKNILEVDQTTNQQIKIKEFLTEKKRHEVEVTAGLVNDLIVSSAWHNETIVVDAGDGKGYLSSRLALEYGHKVLGIDSNPANTENAIERNNKLKKAWNGLKERAELESKGVTPPRRGNWKQKRKQKSDDDITIKNSLDETINYKTTDKFITSDMDLIDIIHDKFPETKSTTAPAVCLTGLHTCGNLAPTCLKLFHYQPHCKLICNIGCCYHLLKEMYSGPEFFGNKEILNLNQEYGFPLSNYLQEKQVKLGRNARMLAAQSIERTLAAKELPNISLFYRALLESLICEQHADFKDTIQVGKIRKFSSFAEYVELCSKKYPLLNVSAERIKQIEIEEGSSKKILDLFYLLRMTFAPVLESLILLDRLLYLQEMGHTQSYLIPVFDPVVSPRHFAIVSIKHENGIDNKT